MRLFYVANNQLPTTKAHGLQIVKMCEAFTGLGVECELIIPRRPIDPSIKEHDIFRYYGIQTPFKITYLWSFGFSFLKHRGQLINKFLFWIQQISFGHSVRKYLSSREGIVYTRDQFTAYSLRKKDLKIYWELHSIPSGLGSGFYKTILQRINGLFVISRALQSKVAEYFSGEIVVVPDAVDLNDFQFEERKEILRQQLGLPEDKKVVMYAGHLYSWKGVDTLVSASHKLPDDFLVVCVGGTTDEIEFYRKQEENNNKIIFLGHKPHSLIPKYLKSADILVIPNSAKDETGRFYTSPLKMFEYMASGRPIVASDLPSLREILNEENAFFFKADDGSDFARGIVRVADDASSATRAEKALQDVQKYTWISRANTILRSIPIN